MASLRCSERAAYSTDSLGAPVGTSKVPQIVPRTLIIKTLCPIEVLILRQIVSCPAYAICKHSQFAFFRCLIHLMGGGRLTKSINFTEGEGGPATWISPGPREGQNRP